MRIKEYNIQLRGTNAILLHKYTTATVSEPGSRITTKDSANYVDEWVKGTYFNKEGQVVIPWKNLMACLFDGAKGMKKGKTALTRVVYTSLMVQSPEIVLLFDGKPITKEDILKNDWLDTCGAVISGRRVDRTRTMIPGSPKVPGVDEKSWELNFEIITKDEILSKEDIQKIIERAGLAAGLGDWRPSSPKKPGSYGTFELVSLEEVR